MTTPPDDPAEIWLEPQHGDPSTGRQWCETDVWTGDLEYAGDGPPTRYIRADLAKPKKRAAA